MKFKLGKKPFKHDDRHLQLAKYLKKDMAQPKPSINYYSIVPAWNMLMNDSLGDCAIAGILHYCMLWSWNAGSTIVATDGDALAGYEQLGGYNPNDPDTDQGCVLADVLKGWQDNGIQLCGTINKLSAYVQVNFRNTDILKIANEMFLGVYLGFQMPITTQDEPNNVWDVVDPESRIEEAIAC